MIAYKTIKAKKIESFKGGKSSSDFEFNTYVYEAADLVTNAYFVSGSQDAANYVGKLVVLLDDAVWMLTVDKEALNALQEADVLHIFFGALKIGVTLGKTEKVIPLDDVGHLLHVDYEESNGATVFKILDMSEVTKWALSEPKSL